MRLWSLHPCYLDSKGLVALWREALLAQKVLSGATKGYRNHPQLNRFKTLRNPAGALASYLAAVWQEAEARGYHFDKTKIGPCSRGKVIAVTRGQIAYELTHLKAKLLRRDATAYARVENLKRVKPHPSFEVVPGPVADWEIIGD